MPHLLNNDTSFSSKQELLDLHDSPLGPNLDTPSPVDSQGSGPRSPFGDASTIIQNTGKLGIDLTEPPLRVKFVPTGTENLCGWGALTPRFIQTFNTPRWVLFFLCVASFLQGMIINGFINTVITSIERRFDLRSYQVSLSVCVKFVLTCYRCQMRMFLNLTNEISFCVVHSGRTHRQLL